ARLRPIQIDQMNALSPLLGPSSRDGDRIVTEDSFLPVIALPKSDTFATTQVDGRKNLHGTMAFPMIRLRCETGLNVACPTDGSEGFSRILSDSPPDRNRDSNRIDMRQTGC